MAIYEYSIMVPQMTSNTAPTPLVASGNHNSVSTVAWNAFDRSNTTYFGAASSPVYLQIDLGLGNGKIIGKYKITPSSTLNRRPRSWTVQGSNDNSSFITLDTQNFSSTPSANVPTEFTISNLAPYRYYRLNITNNEVYPDGSYSEIAEWELQTLTIIYENKILLHSSSGKYYGISHENSSENAVPVLTNNTGSNGVAFSSNTGTTVGTNAYEAFDKKSNTSWGNSSVGSLPIWIGYQFNTPLVITKFSIDAPNVTYYPVAFEFQGSNDGLTYHTLHTVTGNTAGYKEFNTLKNGTYSYYRLYITQVSSSTLPALAEFSMFEGKFKLHSFSSLLESNFKKYGLDVTNNLYPSVLYRLFQKNENNSQSLGVGQVYEHSIEFFDRTIKKIDLK